MGKYGKKNIVSTNLNDFMIGVMAPSGFGKSTLMFETCEKLFGDEGYIIYDCGDEDGVAALNGVVAEKVPTWKTMKAINDDIIKNKETDYPNLKVVVWDTLDAAFEQAENFTVAEWNRENMGQQGFRPATSINSVEQGYGRGLERVIDTVKKEINRLAKVGVRVWYTAHVKEKDQTDLFTGNAYTTLTANMSMKYFNSIKNISHVVGFGYFDRTVEKQEVGEANVVTKKKKTRNTVLDESRKIKFRDTAMVADAKSRFSHIIDEIPLDSDEFIKAIKDAIEAERCSGHAPIKAEAETPAPTKTPAPAVVEEEPVEVDDLDDDLDTVDDTVEFDPKVLQDEIRNLNKNGTPEQKKAVKAAIAETGKKLADITDQATLEALIALFD
jgi:GTPase SAR1 family protein